MKTYTTVQGDMWDSIAFKELGDASHMDKLLRENQQYHGIYIFPSGIVLSLPEVDAVVDKAAVNPPPWKQVAG